MRINWIPSRVLLALRTFRDKSSFLETLRCLFLNLEDKFLSL